MPTTPSPGKTSSTTSTRCSIIRNTASATPQTSSGNCRAFRSHPLFAAFATAGKELARLHVNYETLTQVAAPGNRNQTHPILPARRENETKRGQAIPASQRFHHPIRNPARNLRLPTLLPLRPGLGNRPILSKRRIRPQPRRRPCLHSPPGRPGHPTKRLHRPDRQWALPGNRPGGENPESRSRPRSARDLPLSRHLCGKYDLDIVVPYILVVMGSHR